MAGADTILRISLTTVALVVVVFSAAIGVTIVEPFLANIQAPADSLGWPDQSLAFQYMGLAMAGIALTIFMWLIFAPIRDDLRQEVR